MNIKKVIEYYKHFVNVQLSNVQSNLICFLKSGNSVQHFRTVRNEIRRQEQKHRQM